MMQVIPVAHFISSKQEPWNLVSDRGWARVRARPVEAVIRETSGDPGVSLRPLSRLFTMPAARRDNALQLSTSKDAQERRRIDDDIWEILIFYGWVLESSVMLSYPYGLSLNCSSNTTNFTQSIYKIFQHVCLIWYLGLWCWWWWWFTSFCFRKMWFNQTHFK